MPSAQHESLPLRPAWVESSESGGDENGGGFSRKQRSSCTHWRDTRFRSVRYPFSERVLYHVGLFDGFLIATYVGTLLVKMVHSVVADWF